MPLLYKWFLSFTSLFLSLSLSLSLHVDILDTAPLLLLLCHCVCWSSETLIPKNWVNESTELAPIFHSTPIDTASTRALLFNATLSVSSPFQICGLSCPQCLLCKPQLIRHILPLDLSCKVTILQTLQRDLLRVLLLLSLTLTVPDELTFHLLNRYFVLSWRSRAQDDSYIHRLIIFCPSMWISFSQRRYFCPLFTDVLSLCVCVCAGPIVSFYFSLTHARVDRMVGHLVVFYLAHFDRDALFFLLNPLFPLSLSLSLRCHRGLSRALLSLCNQSEQSMYLSVDTLLPFLFSSLNCIAVSLSFFLLPFALVSCALYTMRLSFTF